MQSRAQSPEPEPKFGAFLQGDCQAATWKMDSTGRLWQGDTPLKAQSKLLAAQGDYAVFADSEGSWLLGPQGQKIELPPLLEARIQVDTQTQSTYLLAWFDGPLPELQGQGPGWVLWKITRQKLHFLLGGRGLGQAGALAFSDQKLLFGGNYRGVMQIDSLQFRSSLQSYHSIWLLEYNLDNQAINWIKNLDGAYENQLVSLAYNAQGEAVLAGHFTGILRWETGRKSFTAFKNPDIFLAFLDSTGRVRYVEQSLNWKGQMQLRGMRIDEQGYWLYGQWQGELRWQNQDRQSLDNQAFCIYYRRGEAQASGFWTWAGQVLDLQICGSQVRAWGFLGRQACAWVWPRPKLGPLMPERIETLGELTGKADAQGFWCLPFEVLTWEITDLSTLRVQAGAGSCLPLALLGERGSKRVLLRGEGVWYVASW